MGQTILTPKQLDFLQLAQTQSAITANFYLTGGTALAEFYLKHRLSEDIDLFSATKQVDSKAVEAFLEKETSRLGVTDIKRSQFLGLLSYKLIYKDKQELKVDFNYYPFPRIESGTKYQKLEVDSLRDIAANKLHTLFMKPRSRDFIDLYFILKQQSYPLRELVLDAKAKFDWDIDRMNLASQFLRVESLTDTPKMLVPFNRKNMEQLFLKLAKNLEKEIFAN